LRGPPKLPLGYGQLQGLPFGLKFNLVAVGMVDGFLATKIFISLKKIVVDVENNNDIPQFLLMFPGEK
jgi:hypothetical protein